MSGEIRRRDFVVVAAAAASGVAIGAAAWPLVDSLNPAADVRGRRPIFSVATLPIQRHVIILVDGAAMMMLWRSADELKALRTIASGRSASGQVDPEFARNWHRSLRPELLVCSAACTREGCLVGPHFPSSLMCPCCGSSFDLAGRAASGPTSRDLEVPRYRFVGDTDIEFN